MLNTIDDNYGIKSYLLLFTKLWRANGTRITSNKNANEHDFGERHVATEKFENDHYFNTEGGATGFIYGNKQPVTVLRKIPCKK